MRLRLMPIILITILIVLAGCAPEETSLPTLIPASNQDAATQEVTTEAATPTPLPRERPTLPPTWTPVPSPTEIPLEVQQAETQAQETLSAPPTLLAVCDGFGEDRERNVRSLTLGESVQVAWTPVQGAVQYSITLVDQTAEALFTDYTAETGYTFRAELFEARAMYGWEVYPIDALGQQMCLSRGAELAVQ